MKTRLGILAGGCVIAIGAIGGGIIMASPGSMPHTTPAASHTTFPAPPIGKGPHVIHLPAAPPNAPQKGYHPPTPRSDPQPAPGIVDLRQGPFPRSVFSVQNMWQGPAGSQWFVVYAGGSYPPGPKQTGSGPVTPGVRVYSEPKKDQGSLVLQFVGAYTDSSAPTGPLTTVSVTGTVMTLRDSSGGLHQFDLVNRKFLS